MLVGDAAGLSNPITGGGIYNAVYSSKLASEIIVKALSGNEYNIAGRIRKIYLSAFERNINTALARRKILDKAQVKDTMQLTDFYALTRRTWIAFKEYWS